MKNRYLRNMQRASERLARLYKSKGDLYNDFDDFGKQLAVCRSLLRNKSKASLDLFVSLYKAMKFNRIHCVFELADKVADIDIWYEDSAKAASAFIKYWGLNKISVSKIIAKYKKILLEGFLELAIRKGKGVTEVDAIRSFRYNMGGRLPEEYFVNLVRGWISEDLAIRWIRTRARGLGIRLRPLAHDADRKIRFKSARIDQGRIISGEPDFLIKRNRSRKEAYLEIQRVDRGKLKQTNRKGERPVNIPGHRPEIEKEALKEHKNLLLFLFNEGTAEKPPEVAIVTNPWTNRLIKRMDGNTYVWAKFINVGLPAAAQNLRRQLRGSVR